MSIQEGTFMNRNRGVFIAVDGPKCAGKSSVLDLSRTMLKSSGLSVFFTKEPTPGFMLENEQQYKGRKLAELLATDRAAHLSEVIMPSLDVSDAVVSDRYIASSLAFQTLDGVPFEEVWALNQQFPLPYLNIFIVADIASLVGRRSERKHHTRLEQNNLQVELKLYERILTFIGEQGVRTVVIDNSSPTRQEKTAEVLVEQVIQAVEAHRA